MYAFHIFSKVLRAHDSISLLHHHLSIVLSIYRDLRTNFAVNGNPFFLCMLYNILKWWCIYYKYMSLDSYLCGSFSFFSIEIVKHIYLPLLLWFNNTSHWHHLQQLQGIFWILKTWWTNLFVKSFNNLGPWCIPSFKDLLLFFANPSNTILVFLSGWTTAKWGRY